ncbi:succinate dehydrogenase/fumarate reductase iron-sulfur subunit [Salisediminibacterium beveridgei]|uniref:Fumarate reductase iron-sulfur subunit n=1 Tax=Salisediminibacterium beveridgei TaxID=632773 RepID=A0A1D7QX14_9BACI|nr:succinate dehydrogenase/fumarate reductase iron-sulfur subunit [Salisediminibacterium beveridgei]AOM83561.1 Succinate dehydrogenase iron-sulfur protein [Salisediminibacterium beveridgei]
MKKLTLQIKRNNGSEQWVQHYVLPYEEGKTLLWALTTIKDEIDPSLNFTSACRHAICGSCAVKVNGHAFLVCKTKIDDLINTFSSMKLSIEPLGNFEVIRDLVIDWEPKVEKLMHVDPWLKPKSYVTKQDGSVQSKEDANKIAKPTDCILCGSCSSECNQLDVNDGSFPDPFIFNKAYRFLVESRDSDTTERARSIADQDIWKCLHCMECVTKCPKAIPLTDEIAYLRQQSIQEGKKHNQGARHAFAFYNDVRNKGRLNEMLLPIRTDGFVSTVGRKIPFAYRMIAKGKINPFHFPGEVNGIHGVRNLFMQNERTR